MSSRFTNDDASELSTAFNVSRWFDSEAMQLDQDRQDSGYWSDAQVAERWLASQQNG